MDHFPCNLTIVLITQNKLIFVHKMPYVYMYYLQLLIFNIAESWVNYKLNACRYCKFQNCCEIQVLSTYMYTNSESTKHHFQTLLKNC